MNCTGQDNATFARTAAWSVAIAEALELLQLLQLNADDVLTRDTKVDGAYGDVEVKTVLAKHLQNHLAVIVRAIFGRSGKGCAADGKQIAKNDIIENWRPLMDEVAGSFEIDTVIAGRIIDRLSWDRDKLIAGVPPFPWTVRD